jgi:hypothetical protein
MNDSIKLRFFYQPRHQQPGFVELAITRRSTVTLDLR